MTPDAMRPILKKLGDLDTYDFTDAKPIAASAVPEVSTYQDVGQVLGSNSFGVPYSGRAAHVIKGNG